MDISRLKSFTYPAITVLIGLSIMAWLVSNPVSSIEAESTFQPDPLKGAPSVSTLASTLQQYKPQLVLYSQVTSSQQVLVTTPIATEVEQVLVSEGDLVEENQQLVLIDISSLERELKQFQARRADINARQALEYEQYQSNRKALPIEENLVEIARRSFERLQNLVNQNLTPSTDLEAAERSFQNQILVKQNRELSIRRYPIITQQFDAQLQELDNQIDQVLSELDDAKIKAPFNGRVSRVQVQNAASISAGTGLLTLVGSGQIELEAWVSANAIDQIDLTKTLTGVIESRGQLIPVKMTHLDPSADNGSIRLFFSPTEDKWPLTINRYYRLWLNLPPVSAVAVPESAIYSNQYVYTIQNNALVRFRVNLAGERFEAGQLWRLVQFETKVPDSILVTRLQNASQGLVVRPSQAINSLEPQ